MAAPSTNPLEDTLAAVQQEFLLRDFRAAQFQVEKRESVDDGNGYHVVAEFPSENPDLSQEKVRIELFHSAAAKESERFRAAAVHAKTQILARIKRWEMLGMLLVTTGGGLGLVCFGPLCERVGRRGAFLAFHIGGLAAAVCAFQVLHGMSVLVWALPVFGFLTLGMHAGYAIYFPELYPTRVRGTGAGFCFNAGRILAAPILFISGWMQKDWGFTLEDAATWLSLLFLVGAVVLIFAPETRGQELPE